MSNIETPATAPTAAWLIVENVFDEDTTPAVLGAVVGDRNAAQARADQWNLDHLEQIAEHCGAAYARVGDRIEIVLPPVGLDAQGLERARNAYASIRKGALTPTRAELDDMRTTVTVLIEAYLGVQ
jgi:hypothetical protein